MCPATCRADAESGFRSADGPWPGEMFPKAGLTSHRHHQPHCPGRRDQLERYETPDPVRSNAVEPRFHCVWQASGRRPAGVWQVSGGGPNGMNAASVPDDLVWAVLELPELTPALTPRSTRR